MLFEPCNTFVATSRAILKIRLRLGSQTQVYPTSLGGHGDVVDDDDDEHQDKMGEERSSRSSRSSRREEKRKRKLVWLIAGIIRLDLALSYTLKLIGDWIMAAVDLRSCELANGGMHCMVVQWLHWTANTSGLLVTTLAFGQS